MILDDKEVHLGAFSKVCTFCEHFEEPWKCKAFDEIPEEIWLGKNDHTKPYKGDNGIQFEKKDTTKAANVGALSGEPGFVPKPPAYDGMKKPIKTKKLEDKTMEEVMEWLADLQEEAKKEVARLYDTA